MTHYEIAELLVGGARLLSRGFGDHTCYRKSDGGVACGGFTEVGQLGDGTNISSAVPVLVRGR